MGCGFLVFILTRPLLLRSRKNSGFVEPASVPVGKPMQTRRSCQTPSYRFPACGSCRGFPSIASPKPESRLLNKTYKVLATIAMAAPKFPASRTGHLVVEPDGSHRPAFDAARLRRSSARTMKRSHPPSHQPIRCLTHLAAKFEPFGQVIDRRWPSTDCTWQMKNRFR